MKFNSIKSPILGVLELILAAIFDISYPFINKLPYIFSVATSLKAIFNLSLLANWVVIKNMTHMLSIVVCLTLDLMALQTKAGH